MTLAYSRDSEVDGVKPLKVRRRGQWHEGNKAAAHAVRSPKVTMVRLGRSEKNLGPGQLGQHDQVRIEVPEESAPGSDSVSSARPMYPAYEASPRTLGQRLLGQEMFVRTRKVQRGSRESSSRTAEDKPAGYKKEKAGQPSMKRTTTRPTRSQRRPTFRHRVHILCTVVFGDKR
ncbi:hypothetical protein B0H14DRAFT_2582796 [Mycena olivaceomarginata]|nr:hypothetical protein B0H14DRAFT_2582796 [Mycena olivaceomarginata]